jgi:hypothetical protein
MHLAFDCEPSVMFVLWTCFFLLSSLHVNITMSAAIAVKTILWHKQENLAPHIWWKLGKPRRIYMLWLCYRLSSLDCYRHWPAMHFLAGVLLWVRDLGSCGRRSDMPWTGGCLFIFCFVVAIFATMFDMFANCNACAYTMTALYFAGFRKCRVFLSWL